MESEEDYPYLAVQTPCQYNSSEVKCKFTGKEFVSHDEEKISSTLCSEGTLSIAVDSRNLHLYKGGVVTGDMCEFVELNHGVLLVGHESDAEFENGYWIVKNSIGPNWGEGGYFRMEAGRNCIGSSQYVVYINSD